MLEALKRATAGIFAKILLFLLILSFAVWGIGDMFVGMGQGAVATVGDTQISVEEFQRAEQNAMANISEQAGQRITAEQARAAGVPNQVLRGIIGQTALRVQAANLGLDLSQQAVVDIIRSSPEFEGPDGTFSKLGFDSFLRQNGLSEAGYVAIRANDELRQQITSALQAAVAVPPAQIEAEFAYQNEKRTLNHVKIDVDTKIDVAEPDEKQLKEYYEANKNDFRTPEYRKFAALSLTLDDIKKGITVPAEDVKRSYEDTKDSYDTPEKRRVQQIVFQSKDEAEKAREKILKEGFMQVAEERGLKESDVSLGMITKDQIFDKAVAEKAFAIKRDELSDVIDGKFGPIILRVIEISEGKESTFEDVKDKVEDNLATERARLEIQERYDLVVEGRNAGKTLKEVSDELKLSFHASDAGDASNKTPDGKSAIDHPDADAILAAIFDTEPGYDNEATELPKSEGYAWYNVLEVTEPVQKPFEDVKDEVKTAYLEQEKTGALREYADKLVERLNNGEDFAAIAKDAGNDPEKTDPPITRNIQPQGLTKEAIELAFTLAEGKAAAAESPDRTSRVVLQVTDIAAAEPPTDKQKETLKTQLQKALRDDYLTTYVEALQNRLGVQVNQAEFDRITGVTPQ